MLHILINQILGNTIGKNVFSLLVFGKCVATLRVAFLVRSQWTHFLFLRRNCFMKLVNAKCPNCGANIKVDEEKDASICEFCGTPFIVDKAISNYNITNNNDFKISNATINLIQNEQDIKYKEINISWEETLKNSPSNISANIIVDGVVLGSVKCGKKTIIKITDNKPHSIQIDINDKKSNVVNVDIGETQDLCLLTDYSIYSGGTFITFFKGDFYLKEIVLCKQNEMVSEKNRINEAVDKYIKKENAYRGFMIGSICFCVLCFFILLLI